MITYKMRRSKYLGKTIIDKYALRIQWTSCYVFSHVGIVVTQNFLSFGTSSLRCYLCKWKEIFFTIFSCSVDKKKLKYFL